MNDATMPGSGLLPVEARRLDLLRQIADAGGALSPLADPHAERGYAYAVVGDDVANDLGALEKRSYLDARFFDRVSLCPKCDSHHLNVREICPGCRRAHLTNEGLLHHFRCGYVGLPSEFSPAGDGGYRCPKCNRSMHHLGTEYDRLGKAFQCRSCGLVSENPPVEAVCLACGARTPAENLISAVVFSYALTSRGASSVRCGSLLDDGENPIRADDAPVLRRAVILEFLDHELKRLQQLKGCFSLLRAKLTPEAMDVGDSLTPWLIRLRQCLREVDLIGQLADAVYLVILPETKRREAEALRRRIETELGPQSPFALAAVEIADVERTSLQEILVRLHAQSEAK
jgi:hypothetical protein